MAWIIALNKKRTTIEENILIDSFSKKLPSPKKFILLIISSILEKKIESNSPLPVRWDMNGIKRDIDAVSNATLTKERNNKK